jgi:DNA-nicking Smr family endonuclease
LNSKISDKDKKDWNDFLSGNEKLIDKETKPNNKKIKKVMSFDFHGYSLDEANKKIDVLIRQAYNNNVNMMKIVTGKGLHSQNEKDPYISKDLGILKNSVPDYVKNNKELMSMINSIHDADLNDGGSGAFYIYLKKNNSKE